MTPSTVLILGAQGRLGGALVTAFSARGWRVLSQVRRPGASPLAMTVIADVRDVNAVVAGVRGLGRVDVVINAANPVYTRWEADAIAMNDAAIAIATALNATLMLPGNVYNFGIDMPKALHMHTPQNAQTSKGQIRVRMELAMASAAATGTQALVIRAGDFFGCSAGGRFDHVVAKDLQKGKLTYPGPLDRMHAWAYVPDLAETFVRVAEARQTLAPFATIHFAGHAVTGGEWVSAMQHIAPHPLKVTGMPWWFIRAVGVVNPLWRALAEMRYLWQRPHELVTAAAHTHLIAPGTPLVDALRASVHALYLSLQWHARESVQLSST